MNFSKIFNSYPNIYNIDNFHTYSIENDTLSQSSKYFLNELSFFNDSNCTQSNMININNHSFYMTTKENPINKQCSYNIIKDDMNSKFILNHQETSKIKRKYWKIKIKNTYSSWTKEEDDKLLFLKMENKRISWKKLCTFLNNKTEKNCVYRYKKLIGKKRTNKDNNKNDDIYLNNKNKMFYIKNIKKENFSSQKSKTNQFDNFNLETNEYSNLYHNDNQSVNENLSLTNLIWMNESINEESILISNNNLSNYTDFYKKTREISNYLNDYIQRFINDEPNLNLIQLLNDIMKYENEIYIKIFDSTKIENKKLLIVELINIQKQKVRLICSTQSIQNVNL